MTYEQFLEEGKKMDAKMVEQEIIIRSFPRGAYGLVGDEVRLNPVYRQALKMFNFWFNAYRDMNKNNKAFVKRHTRERIAARSQKAA